MENHWERDSLSLKDRMGILLSDERSADVKFTFPETKAQKEPTTLHAHKSILANASLVFHKMFYGDLKENTEQAIKIQGIESEAFGLMLEYIYTNKVQPETWDDAGKVYAAAKKYMLNALGKFCINYIIGKLEADNALKVFEFAEFYDENELKEKAIKIIREQTLLVFQSPDFKKIKIDIMMIILEQNELQANEMDLYNALEFLYAENMLQNYQTDKEALSVFLKFQEAIKKIDFTKITAEQFSRGPASSKLLLREDVLAIFHSLTQPSSIKTLYPKDFVRNIRDKILPRVFFDITVDGSYVGRILLELRDDVVPKTIKEFLTFWHAEKEIDRINDDWFSAKVVKGNNIKNFENFIISKLGSGFYITTSPSGSHVEQIGKVIQGFEIINYIGTLSSESDKPTRKVVIKHCNQIDFKIAKN